MEWMTEGPTDGYIDPSRIEDEGVKGGRASVSLQTDQRGEDVA